MKTTFKIICRNDAISAVKCRLAAFISEMDLKYQEEETVERYWKDKNCSEITLSFHCVSLNLPKMKEGMKYISGTSQVEVTTEENCVELACCTSLSDILHNPETAFVICFISH